MKEIFQFGEFRLDVDDHTVVRLDGTKNGTLTEKSFQVLVLLVRRHGHLVTKDELIRFAWPDTIVEDNNLEKCIHHIRQFLGDTAEQSKYIETVRKHGYRFVGSVQVTQVSGSWLATPFGVIETSRGQPAARNATSSGSIFVPAEMHEGPVVRNAPAAAKSQKLSGGYINRNFLNGSNAAEPRAVEDAGAVKTSKRRQGVRRGIRACLGGIAIGFVFLVLLKVLQIGQLLLVHYVNGLPDGVPDPLAETAWSLLVLLAIPGELGIFFGLGLLLFGLARLVWTVFETEDRKVRPQIVERIIIACVVLALLSIAVPNLIYSYRMANKAREEREARAK
jgi:DNA-binding winged helix-turn-helix (wHTH) protein